MTIPLKWRKPRRVFVNSMSDLGHARVPVDFLARVWTVMAVTPQHTYQILSKRPHRLSRCSSASASRTTCGARMARASFGQRIPLAAAERVDGHVDRTGPLLPRADPPRNPGSRPVPLPGAASWAPPSLDLTGIDWLILGGESGPGARRMDLGWVRDLIATGPRSGTSIFVKQLGAVLGRELGAGSKGNHWDAFPEDLRIRDFPVAEMATA